MLKTLFPLFLFAFLIACSTTAPQSLLTPTVTFTPVSSETPVPSNTPVPTVAPTHTPALTPTEDILSSLVPVGEPAGEWNGIPIMPDAIAGEDDGNGYRFTIQAESEEIQKYYALELSNLGWELLTVGHGENGAFLMFFTGSEGTLSVSIIPNGENVIVMIVK